MGGKKKKPGLKVNTIKDKPLIFTIAAGDETTVAIWRERRGQLRIRSTRRLRFPKAT
jgi:hypothetical protein